MTKKVIFSLVACFAIALTYVVNLETPTVDTLLANVEALANNESGGGKCFIDKDYQNLCNPDDDYSHCAPCGD